MPSCLPTNHRERALFLLYLPAAPEFEIGWGWLQGGWGRWRRSTTNSESRTNTSDERDRFRRRTGELEFGKDERWTPSRNKRSAHFDPERGERWTPSQDDDEAVWEMKGDRRALCAVSKKRRAIIAVSKQWTNAMRRPYSDNTAYTTINHQNDSGMQITAPKQQSAKGRMLGAWFRSIY